MTTLCAIRQAASGKRTKSVSYFCIRVCTRAQSCCIRQLIGYVLSTPSSRFLKDWRLARAAEGMQYNSSTKFAGIHGMGQVLYIFSCTGIFALWRFIGMEISCELTIPDFDSLRHGYCKTQPIGYCRKLLLRPAFNLRIDSSIQTHSKNIFTKPKVQPILPFIVYSHDSKAMNIVNVRYWSARYIQRFHERNARAFLSKNMMEIEAYSRPSMQTTRPLLRVSHNTPQSRVHSWIAIFEPARYCTRTTTTLYKAHNRVKISSARAYVTDVTSL